MNIARYVVRFPLLPIYLSVIFWHMGVSLISPFTSIWLRNEIEQTSFLILAIVLSIPGIIGVIGIFGISSYTDKKGHYREAIFIINFIGMIQYLLLTQITTPTHYLYIVGVAALIFPAYFTIIQAFATNLCDINERGKVTSYLLLSASVGWFIGSVVSGRGFTYLGMKSLFIISASMVILSGFVILFIKNPQIVNSSISDDISSTPVPTLFSIIKKKQILHLIISIILLDFTIGGFFVFSGIYLFERIDMSPDLIGYANALATSLGTVFLFKIGKISDRIGRRSFYITGIISYPLFFISISIFHQVVIVFIAFSIPVYVLLRPTVTAMIADLTEENERSRGMSLATVASTLSMTLGAIFAGYLADISRYKMDIWTYFPATFGWISVIFGYFMVKETKLTYSLPRI